MTKTYYFIDDSFYASNGCSCCEPDYMHCFNIDTEKHPCFSPTFGSAHSDEDMMEQVLIHEGLLESDWYFVYDGEDEASYIRDLFSKRGFKIVIEKEWREE